MNQTQKTSLIVLALIVVIGAIAYFTWGTSSQTSPADMNGTSTALDNGAAGNGGVGIRNNGSQGSTAENTRTAPTVPAGLSDAQISQIIASAKVRVPQTGVDVVLTGGESAFTDSSVKGTVVAGPILSKVVTDTGTDIFTDMTIVLAGRPGILHYVAAFHELGSSVTYTSAILIGDRLTLIGVTPKANTEARLDQPGALYSSTLGYSITVNYLDRKNGEPLTTVPTVAKTVTLNVREHNVTH